MPNLYENEAHFVTGEIYDILFENNEIKLNLSREFEDAWVDCDKNIIYLEGNSELGNFKITIERIEDGQT